MKYRERDGGKKEIMEENGDSDQETKRKDKRIIKAEGKDGRKSIKTEQRTAGNVQIDAIMMIKKEQNEES